MEAVILFPHQLFQKLPMSLKEKFVVLVEEPIFFLKHSFHKQKLILHRASLKSYAFLLKDQGIDVHYLETKDLPKAESLFVVLKKKRFTKLHFIDPVDDELEKKIHTGCKKHGFEFIWHDTPLFLNSQKEINKFFSRQKKPFMASFYIQERKKRMLLLDKAGKPLGGKWSLDTSNREKLPKNLKIPHPKSPSANKHVKEAISYIEARFKKNPGNGQSFHYPTNHKEAFGWLQDFLKSRLKFFGPYEDAIAEHESILFHSLLSPLLNTGLLTPQEVIEETCMYAKAHKIDLNSLEGFIRQVIGWREFMRGSYLHYGKKSRSMNFWGHKRSLPKSFWTGKTGLEPIDATIEKILATGYCHHIERLMVLGCFMLLCEVDPDQIYNWFMELFIDAYDWVMVPNVYSMSQYADGGLITTKPYICGSNYILNMSDFKKGAWCAIWDGLYWRFIKKHKKILSKNPRCSMMILSLEKMSKDKLHTHLENAEKYLKTF